MEEKNNEIKIISKREIPVIIDNVSRKLTLTEELETISAKEDKRVSVTVIDNKIIIEKVEE